MARNAFKKQGKEAEVMVSSLLHGLGTAYRVFDNVMLRTGRGKSTTQIDHVVVSPYGIFVIETKSHKGMIFGDCMHRYWTQVLYSRNGSLKYTFYSPFYQNAGHLKNMYSTTGLPCSYFLGIIAFTNPGADLRNVQCPCALRVEYLVNTILAYRQVRLAPWMVEKVCGILTEANVQSKYYERKHVAFVERLKNGRFFRGLP